MKLANPAPLGLSGFALTTFLLSMINAGCFPGAALPLVLASAFVFGGAAQAIAGLMEYARGNTFGFVAFCGYGAFWGSFALFASNTGNHVPAAFVGAFLLLWGLFTVFMWIGSWKLNQALQSVFLALWITFALLGGGDLLGVAALKTLGGYTGLLTALLAFYLAAAEVINETHDRVVLPVG